MSVEGDGCSLPARNLSNPGQAQRGHQLSSVASRHLLATGNERQAVCVASTGCPSRVRKAPDGEGDENPLPERHVT